jgi:DEAD/DEAH box helicase domain-containing protein
VTDAGSWEPLLASGSAGSEPRLIHREDRPERGGIAVPLPGGLPPALVEALATAGITELWRHQAEAIEAVRAGRHVGVVSGTASGKSLVYTVPLVERLLRDPHARVLYLAPTKALARDQARRMADLGLGPALRLAIVDGDADPAERARARREARIVFSNPDSVHHALCPNHDRWAEWLSGLTAIVVDEAHGYRGVFGSHVAHVLRRLRRVAALYDVAPQMILASATVGNPREAFAALTGVDVEIFDGDDAAAPARTVGLWNPALLDPATGRRAPRVAEAANVVAHLVASDLRVICFAPGRQLVERIVRETREAVALDDPSVAKTIVPYRAGYTPEVRRDIERRLAAGDIRAVISTSALEVGIDIGDLDCAVVVGFPGSIAALTQQWGRAGRRRDGLGLLILGEDPLEQWFARHPTALLGRPIEAVALDPSNAAIRMAHLACAAAEAPIGPRDASILGIEMVEAAEDLADDPAAEFTALPAGVIWAGTDNPTARVGLRNAGIDRVAIIDGEAGVVLGDADADRAAATLHPGAVHLHLGDRYRVETLDLEHGEAVVLPFDGDWYTVARSTSEIHLPEADEERWLGSARATLGTAVVTTRVTGFQRRRLDDHALIDQTPLDLPPRTFTATALWISPPPTRDEPDLGRLHAVEHLLTSALPLAVPCDAGDLAGVSAIFHGDVGGPAVILHETHPGGIGILREALVRLESIATTARQIVEACPCETGCPSCIQRFTCPTLNEPLDKAGAIELLAVLTD